jgi:hypothetical protein
MKPMSETQIKELEQAMASAEDEHDRAALTVRVCVCVCMYVCMCVCLCVRACVRACVCHSVSLLKRLHIDNIICTF